MTNEEELERRVMRGQAAERFINDPVLQEALTVLKAHYLQVFESTKFNETKERDEIWRRFQALNDVVSDIQSVIRNGEVAKRSLLDKAKDKVRNLRF